MPTYEMPHVPSRRGPPPADHVHSACLNTPPMHLLHPREAASPFFPAGPSCPQRIVQASFCSGPRFRSQNPAASPWSIENTKRCLHFPSLGHANNTLGPDPGQTGRPIGQQQRHTPSAATPLLCSPRAPTPSQISPSVALATQGQNNMYWGVF